MNKLQFRIVTILLLSGCFASYASFDKTRMIGDQDIFQEYYSLLAELANEPTDAQISGLKSYIAQNPAFERPYFQLLEIALHHQQQKDVKRYFHNLLPDRQHRRNCLWALATLSTMNDSCDVAYELLKNGLREFPASPYYLMQFAETYIRSSYKNAFESELSELPLSQADYHLALVFYYRYAGKISLLRNHLDIIKNEELLSPYILHIQGYLAGLRSDYETANSFYQQGLEASRRENDEQFYNQYLFSLGALHHSHGKIKQSIQFCKEALQRTANINDLSRKILALTLMGSINHARTNYDSAIEYLKKAEELALSIKNRSSLGYIYWAMGQAHLRLNQLAVAAELYDKCTDFAEQIQDISLLVQIHRSKGQLYSELALYNMARHEYEMALSIAEKNMAEANNDDIYVRLALIYQAEGKYKKSQSVLQKAVMADHLTKDERCYRQFMLADAYEGAQNYPLALSAYHKVCEIAGNNQELDYVQYLKALALTQIGVIETELGNFAKARSILEQPLLQKMAQQRGAFAIDYFASIGDLYRHCQELDSAVIYYKKATDIIESSREQLEVGQFRIGYFSPRSIIYDKVTECHFERYRHAKNDSALGDMFLTLQQSTGRSIQDMVSLKKKIIYPQEYRNAFQHLSLLQYRMRTEFVSRNQQLPDSILIEHNISRHVLVAQRLQILDQNKAHAQKHISLAKVRRLCSKNNMAVLHYHISEKQAFVFVIHQDYVNVVPLEADRSVLQGLVDSLLVPLQLNSTEKIRSASFRADIAHELYCKIFEPVKRNGQLPEQLYVVADPPLVNLPFEMLLSQSAQKPTYTPTDASDYHRAFLQNDFIFTYSPSIAALLNKNKITGRPSVAIFSNPLFYESPLVALAEQLRSPLRSKLSILPFSEREAMLIKSRVENAKHFHLEDATEQRVLNALKKHDIIHIATHAFVDSSFDAFSGVALARPPDSSSDGLLMGYEIQDMALKNDLIVLSACESGQGRLVAGEGVLGLPRLFLRAGAGSVIMSLWKVHDPFPSKLMPEFYDQHINRGKSIAEALALAKRQVLKASPNQQDLTYQHPFFWATFCLYGSPGVRHSTLWIHFVLLILCLILLIFAGRYLISRRRHQNS